MDFIKKNYEKILLGVVLLVLAAAVAYLPIKIAREKGELKAMSEGYINKKPKPLDPLDMTRLNAGHKRLETPAVLEFSGSHNLFNPVQWQKLPNGVLRKNQTGGEVAAGVTVTKINPLFTTISYESPGATEGTYLISVQRDAELKAANRGKKSKYYTLDVKGDFFTLRKAGGPAEKPELELELNDTGERVKISSEKSYQRTDGYSADLRYDPEKKVWLARRVGDKVTFAGDDFTIAAIKDVATNQFEVVLKAKSTDKKTTIRFNGAM